MNNAWNAKLSQEPVAGTFRKGFGYWDITHYPYGGCFKRARADMGCVVFPEPAGKYDWERKVRFADGSTAICSLQNGLTIQH